MLCATRIFLLLILTCGAILKDLSEVEAAKRKATAQSTTVLAASTTKTPAQKPDPSPPTSPVADQKESAEKSPSIIQMLEGRENDLILWASIAVVAFAMGWVFGGNYYVRRDRARSRKLRF